MSQHTFKTTRDGEPICVLMGWDRPLAYFFLVVERLAMTDDENAYLYLYLDDPGAIDCSLDYYRSKLVELGIVVPEAMFAEVERDGALNVGNRVVEYSQDGTSVE